MASLLRFGPVMASWTTARRSIAVLTALLAACSTPSIGDAPPSDPSSPTPGTESNSDAGGTNEPDGPRTTTSGDLIVESDMLFPGMFVKSVTDAVAFNVQRWPDATVPYEIAPDVPNPERISKAASQWTELTGIRFIVRKDEPNYVRFVNGDTSRSFLGCIGGKQEISLRLDTTDHPTEVTHVLGHVLGFAHQHTRADRDGFITVALQNVEAGRTVDFDKSNINPLGDYDIGSVMQLGSDFLSKNGQPTMTAKTGEAIAPPTGLSAKDATTARGFYVAQLPPPGGTPQTDGKITVSWPAKSNTALYSLDVQLADSSWVAPCIGAELLKRNLWTKFDGTCPSSATSPGPVTLPSIKAFRVCWTEFEDWSKASCQTKAYAQETSIRIAP